MLSNNNVSAVKVIAVFYMIIGLLCLVGNLFIDYHTIGSDTLLIIAVYVLGMILGAHLGGCSKISNIKFKINASISQVIYGLLIVSTATVLITLKCFLNE